ncbi:RDD family protein [Pseudolysobacter antarcticus]|uniref:RDD family protein n=1 Tax=Pseudolysobacter antarcticus TaxID=2511995 RepID=A0A411HJ37_9GAMM|nr:RDD family protein [Pseudolysobacter antarcticus]QBB70424.1 RDD family protein [Pseudolysobacter antarcticus]
MEVNPYQAPSAKLTDDSVVDVELADRLQRLGAALLDGLIGLVYALPIMFLLGTYDYLRQGHQAPWHLTAGTVVLGFIGFILLNGYYLKKDGQTIGKRIVGIRIVDMDNQILTLGKILVLRYLPIRIAAMIPFAGGLCALVDMLFIFRQNRRCLHDLIAGTKVVKVK